MKSSIIIPSAGRPEAIRVAVRSVLAQAPSEHSAEVLVVDNNTDESLAQDMHAYCASLGDVVRYVREPSPGLSAARHRGVDESRGALLTFIDDDVEVMPGWLDAIQRRFDDPNVGMVGGPSIPKFTGSVPAWFWSFLGGTPHGGWMCPWLSLLDLGRSVSGVDPDYIWGLNFSIRRPVLERCGGFHPDLVPPALQRWQGDGETGLTGKVRAAGVRADYVQEALLLHACGPERLNEEYFAKRAFYQGVCASFARIRAGQDPSQSSSPRDGLSLADKFRSTAGEALQRLAGPRWHDAAGVRDAAEKAHAEGWHFHQAEVAADPKLLAWVRRESFRHADIGQEMAR
jgi:glycosyltransferase involved in cell wall biosynthesis